MATLGKERGVLPVLAVLLLLMFTSFLTQVYASLAIGHQWTAHRIPGSLLALAASSVLRYIAARVLSFAGYEIGMRKIVSAWMNQGNMSVWKAMAVNGLFNLLLMLIFGFITRFVLDRKSAQISRTDGHCFPPHGGLDDSCQTKNV